MNSAVQFAKQISRRSEKRLRPEIPGSVIEGSYSVKQGDGDWKTYKPGESWHVPAGVVHESKPESAGKTINAFIVEKGKPLINPVQKP